MGTATVRLVEANSGELVDALLHDQLTPAQIVAAETSWEPVRAALAGQVEHDHWDWRLKAGLLARAGTTCAGIECGGEMQGMALLLTSGFYARLAPDAGQPLVYLDFVEVAPWNLRRPNRPPRFKVVGATLVRHAVRVSLGRGWSGRVGLKALPQAEGFYQRVCGMVSIPPARYNDLVYYELTAAAAATFLAGGLP